MSFSTEDVINALRHVDDPDIKKDLGYGPREAPPARQKITKP